MEIRALLDLAAAVRGRRRLLKLSQSALADIAGVSRTFVADVEAGKPTVEFGRVVALIEALDFTLVLVDRAGTDVAGTAKPEFASADVLDLDQFLRDYDKGIG